MPSPYKALFLKLEVLNYLGKPASKNNKALGFVEAYNVIKAIRIGLYMEGLFYPPGAN